jgi:hypothetical protein
VISIKEHREFVKVLMAVRELDAWERRRNEVLAQLKTAGASEKANLRQKLVKINNQIKYYTLLNRDMKRGMKPTNIPDLLTHLIGYRLRL